MSWSDQIIRDFRVFSDPATDFEATESGDLLRIKMIRSVERDYVLEKSGPITSRGNLNRRYVSVQALLASDEFVDIRSFKATQRRILAAKNPDGYLNPEGQILDSNSQQSTLNIESFRSAIAKNNSDHLAILLLDGPAGIGKTSLIERMVYERSEPSAAYPPLLHVTSGGSRLTDLNKALAHATQLLRSQITFDQVPILARLGVLQVAIDGFDELVDPDGYKDAWSALREFLGEVQSGGPIILSGRDTFFDQQSFERRLADRIKNLELRHARLSPMSPNVARGFLVASGWSESDISSAQSAGWFRPGSYYLRPFFLRQIGTAEGWRDLQQAHGSPPAFLVSRFVTREASLITKMANIDQKNAEHALWDFYGNIVEDMAMQESDAVDEAYLGLACEAAFESFVSGEDLTKLIYKAGSFGLLEADEGRLARKFPHSELQNQFLARQIINSLERSAAVSSFLRRGVLNTTLLDAFADQYSALPSSQAGEIAKKLERILSEEPFGERLASNVTALLVATLSRPNRAYLKIESRVSNEVRMVGSLEPAYFDQISFAHLDARGADCRLVQFHNCVVGILTVDDDTVFGEFRPTVLHSLQIEHEGTVRPQRAPVEINKWLDQHSVALGSDAGERDLPLVRYFDRLCRKFIRQHQIREHTSDEAYFLIQDPYWMIIRDILGGRIERDTRATSGPKNVFYRMTRPDALLNPPPGDGEDLRLRAAIVRRARELEAAGT